MEKPKRNEAAPDQSLLNVRQASLNQQRVFYGHFPKPNEANQNMESFNTNRTVLPKNSIVIELQIEKILAHKFNPIVGQNQFLVKYKNRSYHDIKWISPLDFGAQAQIMNEYLGKNPVEPNEPYFNPNYLIPEKVISFKKIKNQKQYLVKWVDLGYNQSTWENEDSFKDINEKYNNQHNLIEEYERRIKSSSKEVLTLAASPNFHPILEFHISKTGKQLNSLQIDALNFLFNSWCFTQNALISNNKGVEARLGVVTFLEKVINCSKGNFLIIADQESIEKWIADINEWTNDLDYFSFIGEKEDLDIMKKYEFSKTNQTNDDFIYPLYLTTYENFNSYHKIFSLTFWEGVILDDTNKGKIIFNKSALNFISGKIKMKFKVIMTPPLKDSDPHKAWPWLNFTDTNNFHLESRFLKYYCKDGKIDIDKLNASSLALLENYNNNKFELKEILVKCPLSNIQEDSIKSIYSPLLTEGSLNQNLTKSGYNIKQIGVTTRKLLNHPFLIKDVVNKVKQEKKKSFFTSNLNITDTDFFLRASGKLFVLDMLLKKFKSECKNVVIICQTLESIEILEKYMLLRAFSYEKVDLYTRGRSRIDAVNQFNNESRRIFAFILDTKTGYFTMKADHVIIYESDWITNNDIFIALKILSLQNNKEVYRLITDKTYECAFMNKNISISELYNETSMNIETDIICKLVYIGLDEFKSEELINENTELNRYIASENPEIDYILEKYTFTKKYHSIDELSNHISLEKWKNLFHKVPEKKVEPLNKNNSDKNYIPSSKQNPKLISQNEDSDIDIENEEESENENDSLVEEVDFNEIEFDEDEMKPDNKGWTPKIICQLFNLMLRYGVFQCELFAKLIPLPVEEIMRVCVTLAYFLLSKTKKSNKFIILQRYLDLFQAKKLPKSANIAPNTPEDFNIYLNNDFSKYHMKSLKKIASTGVEKKLSRLELLFIADVSYKARQKSKGHPTIPSARPSTLLNDIKIMEVVMKKGFPITKYTLSLKNTKMTLKRINHRILSICEDIKTIFSDYCQIFEIDILLTPEKLLEALKMFNNKEKKKIFQAIQIHGIDNLSITFEATKFKKDKSHIFMKYINQFKKFSFNVIRSKKVPFDFFGNHYPLSYLTDFIFDIAILHYIRDSPDVKMWNENDQPLFEYIKENGYKDIAKQEIFTKRFKDPVDKEFFTFLHEYFRDKKKLIYKNFFKSPEFDITSPVKNDTLYQNFFANKEDAQEKADRLTKFIESDFPKNAVLTDDEIQSILPIKINENTVVTNIGKVVTDRPAFHSERYLYLSGFTSERYFPSIRDPNVKEWYVCQILDNGGELPVFRIQPKNDPSVVFEGNVPSRPSIELLKKISFSRFKSKSSKSPTISGPEFFAFASPKIRKIMEHLPGANKCPKFKGYSLVYSYDNIEETKKKTEKEEKLSKSRKDVKRSYLHKKAKDYDEEIDEEEEEDMLDEDDYEDEDDDDDDDDYDAEDEDDDDIEVYSKMKTRRGRNKQINYNDDDDEEEDEDDDQDDDDGNDDKGKSLIQRVKERKMKERKNKTKTKLTKMKKTKQLNLRKRNNRKNYNEYEEEEEEDNNDYYDDNDNNDENEYDYVTQSTESDKNDNKSSPNAKKAKCDTKRVKDKKKSGDLLDSSDEENYYQFACKNIFSNLGNKTSGKNLLNSGVVFYFDKLAGKNHKDFIQNCFSTDSDMLFIDQGLLTEFISKNPRFAHFFSNK